MTLHIFNPEHDLALAANLSNFTAPHAGRQLRADLGFLPALWAEVDDYVLVDCADDARRDYLRLTHVPFDRFVEKQQLGQMPLERIEPWGWDLAIRNFLLRQHVSDSVLPVDEQIATMRDLSHRRHAVDLLPLLQRKGTTGESRLVMTADDVVRCVGQWRRAVLKAPWSSSGRGIRFVEADEIVSASACSPLLGWIRNVLDSQGSIVVEPYYNKVKDLAMEFRSTLQGSIIYCGLSLFHTQNGAYTGNIVATEQQKREMISRYLPTELLDAVSSDIIARLSMLTAGALPTSFGIDMMVVTRTDREGFLLHPCVEINLRRTMGHVALAERLTRLANPESGDGFPRVMDIRYTDNHYKLKIRKL